MKLILAVTISVFSFSGAFAQEETIATPKQQGQATAAVGCIDRDIKMQAEDLKRTFIKQDMVPYRDAMINMASQEPFPVAVQLNKGQMYQLLFIGGRESSKVKLELFDGNDKRIVNKSTTPIPQNVSSNYIIYTFIPEKTDVYLVMLTQKQKNRNICGSFTIMQQNKPQNKK